MCYSRRRGVDSASNASTFKCLSLRAKHVAGFFDHHAAEKGWDVSRERLRNCAAGQRLAEIRRDCVEVEGVYDSVVVEVTLLPGCARLPEVCGERGKVTGRDCAVEV